MGKKIFNLDLKDILIYGSAIGLASAIFFFLLSVNIIGYDVKLMCQLARDKYSGDCVEALGQYLDDEQNDIRNRNSAIWALGQLGDERSRIVLEKWYTGYQGERISLSRELSQYELRRAIGYLEGNANITTFFWRFGSGID